MIFPNKLQKQIISIKKHFYKELKILLIKNFKKVNNYLVNKMKNLCNSILFNQRYQITIYLILANRTFYNDKKYFKKKRNQNNKLNKKKNFKINVLFSLK